MAETSKPSKPVETGFGERTAYAAYFAGQNIVYTLIQGYLLLYSVSYLGLDPALVATMFLVVRIWDAINDPLIGVLMDRFRFPNSRFKGWLNITAFLVPISTFTMFLIPAEGSMGLKIGWLVVTYLIWDVLYTTSEVPIFAISTAMTLNERERTALLALTQIGSVLGVIAGAGIITVLLGDGVDHINWLLLGGLPSLLALVVMIPQMFVIRERYHPEAVEDVSLVEMLRDVLRNDQHLIVMSLFLSQTFLNAMAVFAVYVAEGFYGDAQLASITQIFSLFGIVILGALSPVIIERIGKKRYLEVSMIATIILSIPVFFIPASMPLLALAFIGFRLTTLIVTSILRPMFTADCVEYGEHKTGTRSEATAFAIQTFFNKTGDALGVAMGGYIMALVGFNEALPLAQQAAGVIDKLWLWFVILPMLMAAVFWIGSRFFYKLDEAQVKTYIAANEARQAAASAAAGD